MKGSNTQEIYEIYDIHKYLLYSKPRQIFGGVCCTN